MTMMERRCYGSVAATLATPARHPVGVDSLAFRDSTMEGPGVGRLEGKVVLIAGGAGAIGLATARRCMEERARSPSPTST